MIKRYLYPVSHLLTHNYLHDLLLSLMLQAPQDLPHEHLPVTPLLPSLHPSWAGLLPLPTQAMQFPFVSPAL